MSNSNNRSRDSEIVFHAGKKENWAVILISKQTSQYDNLIKQKKKNNQQKYKYQNIDMTFDKQKIY